MATTSSDRQLGQQGHLGDLAKGIKHLIIAGCIALAVWLDSDGSYGKRHQSLAANTYKHPN